MKQLIFLVALVLAAISGADSASVTLYWEANKEPPIVTGYRIYIGLQSRVYDWHYEAGLATTYQVDGLTFGTKYFFAATAFNQVGESGYSNELEYTSLPPVEDQIRFFVPLVYNGPHRMAWGWFSGGRTIEGPYTLLYRITPYPKWNWNRVTLPPGTLAQYKVLRYDSPKWQYGQVAEIEFIINGKKATGTPFGSGTTFERAFDGDVNTYVKEPAPDGNFVGLIIQ